MYTHKFSILYMWTKDTRDNPKKIQTDTERMRIWIQRRMRMLVEIWGEMQLIDTERETQTKTL